jgi:antitoxin (DNA-binding transcriptional repressor) of toxin-antitoxin stability system
MRWAKAMREVGAFEAKNKLGQLLGLVERGEEVVITRYGRQVARPCAAKTSLQS